MGTFATAIDQKYIEELSGILNTKINDFDDFLRCIRGIEILSQLNLSNNSSDLESQILSLKCNMIRLKSTLSEQIQLFCLKEINNSNEIDNLSNFNI